MTIEQITGYLPAVMTTFFGGAGAQILIKVWTRRADLRQMDTGSDLNQAAAYEKLVGQLMTEGDRLRAQLESYETRVSAIEAKAAAAAIESAGKLQAAHDENMRLTVLVARLHSELDTLRVPTIPPSYHPGGN